VKKKDRPLNAAFVPFIVRSSFLLLLLIPIGCGEKRNAPQERTGSSENGMLKEKESVPEIKGRIGTLRKKFAEMKEPPRDLDPKKKELWQDRLRKADSTLKQLERAIEGAGKKGIDPGRKARIDRTLQRIAIQARSMEKALQKGN
jgi:hypothetical protein